jgi:hypothetical protein
MLRIILLTATLFICSCISDNENDTQEHYHYHYDRSDTITISDTVTIPSYTYVNDTVYITETKTIIDTVHITDTIYVQSPEQPEHAVFKYESTTDWSYGSLGTDAYVEGQSLRYLNEEHNLEKIVYVEFDIVVDSLVKWINHTPSDTYIGNKIYGE